MTIDNSTLVFQMMDTDVDVNGDYRKTAQELDE
ncbi:hypothetical protein D8834_05765 [Streptococcus oralis]|nr:hypothetical protein D8834_05765 [Streptococcus oralis]